MCLPQRSCDVSCGFPADIFTFALLLHMVCHEVNITRRKNNDEELIPGQIHHMICNAHIYTNNMDHTEELLSRDKINVKLEFEFPKDKSIWDFEPEDIKLIGYDTVIQNQPKFEAKLNLNARPNNREEK